MICPFCDSPDTRVTNSRPFKEGSIIRRRRHCPSCGAAFHTRETVEPPPLRVLKRGGTAEDYSRDRLMHSIRKAFEKRSITPAEVERMAMRIEKDAFADGSLDVTSAKLGELVLNQLKLQDPVAYLRFISVYKNFRTLEEMEEELRRIRDEG